MRLRAGALPRCTPSHSSALNWVWRAQVYKKLERELHEKKREIASVIDVSNIAYEARDQARALQLTHRGRAPLTRAPLAPPNRRATRSLLCGHSLTRNKPRLRWSTVRCACRPSRVPCCVLILCRLSAAGEAHRRGPQGARGGPARRGGEDLRVRAAGGREATQGKDQLGRGAREENQGGGG